MFLYKVFICWGIESLYYIRLDKNEQTKESRTSSRMKRNNISFSVDAIIGNGPPGEHVVDMPAEGEKPKVPVCTFSACKHG